MTGMFTMMFTRLLGNEGGYSTNPKDPGGETNWGISKRSYPALDIAGLTQHHAMQIYYDDFWTPLKLDLTEDGIAWQLFDFAVNSGIQTAIRAYQRALNVADDGHFGPTSLNAAQMMSEADQIMRILAERLEYMTKTNGWATFGKGWANRVATNLRYGALDS